MATTTTEQQAEMATTGEFCRRTGFSHKTVLKLLDSGELPGMRLGLHLADPSRVTQGDAARLRTAQTLAVA